MFVAGIDLGGSSMRVALASETGMILARQALPIDAAAGPEALLARAVETIRALQHELGVAADSLGSAGIGTPGLVDARGGRVRSASNLAGWLDVPVRSLLTARLGVPICIENDVNMAALGEQAYGVGRGWHSFVFVALGTGLGAGLIVNGELLRGAHDASGEIGYTCIDEQRLGPLFRREGRLEALVGGSGISRRAWRLRRDRGAEEASSDGDVFAAARAGDVEAKELVIESARWLGIAIGNLAAALDPEGVVLGGGIGAQADLLLAPIRAVVRQIAPAPVLIVPSALGADAQLRGAIASALRLLDARAATQR